MDSIYWVFVTFTTIGYGEITARTINEIMFCMFVEIVGVGVFGYLTGTFQTFFSHLGTKDELYEFIEQINLWLLKIDRQKPDQKINRKMYDDVRDYYLRKFKHTTTLVFNEEFFPNLKPRLQKQVLDQIFQLKYNLFKEIFQDCNKEFQRQLIL